MSFGQLVGQNKTPRLANNEVNNRYRHRKAAFYRTQDKCIKHNASLQNELPNNINIFKKKYFTFFCFTSLQTEHVLYFGLLGGQNQISEASGETVTEALTVLWIYR